MNFAPAVQHTNQKQIVTAVRDYSRRLFSYIRRRVATDQDAEDLLQDVFQQFVATSINEPIEQVSAWLYKVAGNKIIDWYRKKKPISLEDMAVNTDSEDESTAPEYLFADHSSIADELLDRKIFWQKLHDALAELPREQRDVFVMHELEGLSFSKMEKLTGVGLNTLLSRKRYAVVFLRKKLETIYGDMIQNR